MDINFDTLSDFRQTISTAFFNSLASAPPSEWQRVAMKIGSSSSRNTYPFLGELESMREWLGERIVRQLASHRYAIENRKFELTMSARRDEMEDDAGGAVAVYASRAEIMARAVAVHPDEIVMGETLVNGNTTACYDGQNFFDTDHPYGADGLSTYSNDLGGSGDVWYLFDTSRPLKPLIYQLREAPKFQSITDLSTPEVFKTHEFLFGAHTRDAAGYGLWQTGVRSAQTLNETNFKLARQQMQKIKNDQGRNMGLNPNLIVVSRGPNQDAAIKLFSQAKLATGEDNYLLKVVDVMVSNYLPFA